MSEASPHLISSDVFAARIRALLPSRGTPRVWPKRQQDRWVLLHAVARRLDDGELLTEREANARIQNWLLGPASALAVDFVTVRRALIDYGFWDREPGGSGYRRSSRHERWVRFEGAMPDELDVLAAAIDAADERRRSFTARDSG